MADPVVKILFSGLMLFVREAEARRRVTHVLFREARNHDDPHDPLLCVPGDRRPISLDRELVELRWLQDGEELPVEDQGALPKRGVIDVGEFPPRNKDFFYWTPYLGSSHGVDRKCLGIVDVPSTVVASVRLRGGQLYNGDFAFVEERDENDNCRKGVAIMQFVRSAGSPGVLREQAASETVVWEPEIPEGATHLEVRSTRYLPDGAQSVERAFHLGNESPVFLTISNNSRPTLDECDSDYRGPGAKAPHFEMLYDLLTGTPTKATPRAPNPFRWRDQGQFKRNVTDYTRFGDEFADCHLNWHPDAQGKYGKRSTKYRPICIPAVADAAREEEEVATE